MVLVPLGLTQTPHPTPLLHDRPSKTKQFSPPAHFQNHEMSYAFLMILKPAATLPPTSKTMKMMTDHAFLMILTPAASLPPTPKTMKMMTVLCIAYDSPPSHPFPNT